PAVDHGQRNVFTTERARRVQTAETTTDDDDAGSLRHSAAAYPRRPPSGYSFRSLLSSSRCSPTSRRISPSFSWACPPISSTLPSACFLVSPVRPPTASFTRPLAFLILPLSSSLFMSRYCAGPMPARHGATELRPLRGPCAPSRRGDRGHACRRRWRRGRGAR